METYLRRELVKDVVLLVLAGNHVVVHSKRKTSYGASTKYAEVLHSDATYHRHAES